MEKEEKGHTESHNAVGVFWFWENKLWKKIVSSVVFEWSKVGECSCKCKTLTTLRFRFVSIFLVFTRLYTVGRGAKWPHPPDQPV